MKNNPKNETEWDLGRDRPSRHSVSEFMNIGLPLFLGVVFLLPIVNLDPARAQAGPINGTTGTFSGLVTAGAGLTVSGGTLAAGVIPAGASVSRLLSARFSDTINVLDYGAKCDGSTNDAAAFAAAETAAVGSTKASGAEVYVPGGKCYLASSPAVTVPAGKSIAIVGDGSDVTVLKFAPGVNGLAITLGAQSGATVESMTIDRSGSTTTGNTALAITETASASGNVTVRELTTKSDNYPGSWANGIVLTSTDNAVVDHVYTIAGFSPETSNGLLIQGVNSNFSVDTKITNSKFQGGNVGLLISGYVQGVLAANIFSIADNYGISWTDGLSQTSYAPELLEITNAHINSIKEDIQVYGLGMTLTNSLLWRWPDGSGDSTPWTAVDLSGSTSSVITGNNVNGGNGGTFTGSEYFVHLTNTSAVPIASNTVVTINGPAIQLDGNSSINQIVGNVLNGVNSGVVDNAAKNSPFVANTIDGIGDISSATGRLVLQAPIDAATGITATLSSGGASNPVGNQSSVLLHCSGTLASFTFNLPGPTPSLPADGTTFEISSECLITAFTVAPYGTATVIGSPGSISATSPIKFRYYQASNEWVRSL